VKSGLITSRRIIFTPNSDLKEELANTAIQITCYDRTGKEVKRVTSDDEGNVEDDNGNDNGNGNPNDNTGGGTNTGGDSGSIVDGTDEG